MPNIFISYRQKDSPGDCRQLCERLQECFGEENVFFDIQSIPLGDNWWEVARQRILLSNVVLVPIGQTWATITDRKGRRRLDDPRDPLRMELTLALQHKIRTIPVLVEGASLPEAEKLPEEIRDLVDRNYFELRHRSFARDVDALIEKLGGDPKPAAKTPAAGEDVISVLVRGVAAKLGERLAGGSTPTQPPQLPPSIPTYPPPQAMLNLSGIWQGMNGVPHQVWQQGNVITVEARNPMGNVVLRGQGSLIGNELCIVYDVTYQPPFVVRGEARGFVSPDGMSISGQMVDQVMGMQRMEMRRVG